jgi:hypothetical protein
MLVGILGAEATEKFVVSMDKAVTESFAQSSFRNHCVSVLLLLLQQLMTLGEFLTLQFLFCSSKSFRHQIHSVKYGNPRFVSILKTDLCEILYICKNFSSIGGK